MTITSRAYHERTKHSEASVRASPMALDWENQPLPFKVYPDLAPLALPTDLPGSQVPALAAIHRNTPHTTPGTATGAAPGARTADRRPIDVAALAHLLFFSAGVLRRRSHPGGAIFFRAAACTGALYHVDVYVVCAELAGVPAGVHHFGPHDFALRTLRAGDHRAHLVAATADDPHVRDAPVVLALTSTFWRNAWKYRERTYRHAFWDAGTMLANLLAAAAALGVPAHVVMGFVDRDVERLVDLDRQREVPLALVALGAGAASPPPAPELAPLDLATLPLSKREIAYPILAEAHAASSLPDADAVRRWRSAGAKAPPPATVRPDVALAPLGDDAVRESIEPVIARRGSTRRFPRTAIALDRFATLVHAATRPVPLDVAAPVDLHLIVHAVDGLDAGTYRAAADGRMLERGRTGDLRRVAGHLDLGQALAADAAANCYWLADLAATEARLGDRGYRAVQLAAAIAGGRVYLAAYALGLGATGLTFFDDDVTELLAPSRTDMGVMFLMAVGAGRT
jgi:SagB-type dehydrogenase family enzyme